MADGLPNLARFDRQEFLETRWSYRAGEHVTFCGPTERGKTTLTFQLLERSATPELPAIFFAMKPKDDTVKRWGEGLGYRTVKSWPPPMSQRLIAKPPGYVLWPETSFNPDTDNVRQWRTFRGAMLDSYRRGNRIVVGDEHFGLMQLGLEQEMIALWSRGRSMGTGFWGGVQKPSHIPAWGFNQASHMFLWNDPDMRNVKRFAEFGGIDSRLLIDTVLGLDYHETLYVRRRGNVACIVNS